MDVEILNPPRPGKKLMVTDIDYTIFDLGSAAEKPMQLARYSSPPLATPPCNIQHWEHGDRVVIYNGTRSKCPVGGARQPHTLVAPHQATPLPVTQHTCGVVSADLPCFTSSNYHLEHASARACPQGVACSLLAWLQTQWPLVQASSAQVPGVCVRAL